MALVGGYVVLCLYLDTAGGRTHVADKLAQYLSGQTGARVEIESARLGLPGHIYLKGVRIYDRADTLMISAGTLEGSVSLFSLLASGSVRLRSVALLDGFARIYRVRGDTAMNIQFFLDAFKGEEETARPTDVQVSQLVVRRFGVTYDVGDGAFAAPGRFCPDHIAVCNLSASAALPTLTDSLIHLRVRSLSFTERSGLAVQGMRGELWRYAGGLKLRDFDIRLPDTHIAQHELTLTFSDEDFIGTLHTSGTLADARISTDDLTPIVPALASLHTNLWLSTAFDVTPQRVVLRGADFVTDRPSALFRGDVQFDRDAQGLQTLVLRSDRLAADMPSLSQFLQAVGAGALPEMLTRLGGVDFQGNLAWHRDAATSFDGTLSTAQGTIRGKMDYQPSSVKATMLLDNVRLASLLQNPDLPEPLTATVDGTLLLVQGTPQGFDGRVSLQQTVYKGRMVRGITAEGHADREAINVMIDSNDPAATLHGKLSAALAGNGLRGVRWEGVVNCFQPASWGLDAPQDLVLSLDGTVQAEGLAQLAALDGNLNLNRVTVTGGGLNIDQRNIALSLHPDGAGQGHTADLHTAYGEVSLHGPLDVKRLTTAVEGLLGRALPDFAPMILGHSPVVSPATGEAKWTVRAEVRNDAIFSDVIHLPVAAPDGLYIDGTLAEGAGRTALTVRADTLSYSGEGFSQVNAYLQGEDEEYSLLVQTRKDLAGMQMELAATVQTTGRELTTQVSWRDEKQVFRGELAAYTVPVIGHHGRMRTELQPTEVFFKDSVWSVAGGTVLWGGDTLAVNRMLVEHENQRIVVDGSFSAGSPDSITADLRAVDLEYVFDLLKFHPVYFAGVTDGRAVLTFADKRPVINARLDIWDFSINSGSLGRADIRGEVDLQSLTVHLDADLLDAPHGRTLVKGMVLPRESSLDLAIDSRGTNIEFLRRYIGGILHDISGRATGKTRLFGTFQELQLTGDIMADLSGGLPVLGCRYNVDSAHVVMTPGVIDILSGRVRDAGQGTAQAKGRVSHKHLGDFRYTFDFNLDHCLIYDRPRSTDLPFSSHALASGSVGIKGEPGRLDCDINVRPERGSDFHYHMDLPEDYTSSTLLNIRPAPSVVTGTPLEAEAEKEQPASASDVYMTLNLDMQPDVPLTVIMDERTGDNIVVQGSGPLRATYYNKGQFNLFGTYTVESGIYKMTIQDIIHKDFRFKQGGTVNFGGKPFDGVMDMQAVYTVPSASLADLNLTGGVSQNGVRVNCLLNFSGQLHDPKVHFDLDMPTVSQDVKQMVRSLISTDEEMNRQVLYLLAIGRFFTYDYASTDNAQSQGETAMNSFLSNTLSGQLNNFIASAMGQSNWTFGTSLSTGTYGWEDVGVEGQIGGRLLNNRLLVNGNFGYRNSVTQQSGNFVGDFDVQYLLTPGGSMRLKAYNETNDRYFTKNSLTTQGVGIVVQRSFNHISDLFRRKKPRE